VTLLATKVIKQKQFTEFFKRKEERGKKKFLYNFYLLSFEVFREIHQNSYAEGIPLG